MLATDVTDWIQAIGVVIGVGIGVVGTIVAARGLKTWRAQLYGESRHESARALLRAALAVRDELVGIAAWLARHTLEPVEDLGRRFGYGQAFTDRLGAAQRNLDVATIDAEVVLSADARLAAARLSMAAATLNAAIDAWRTDPSAPAPGQSPSDLATVVGPDGTVSEGFRREIAAAVERVETFARTYLAPH